MDQGNAHLFNGNCRIVDENEVRQFEYFIHGHRLGVSPAHADLVRVVIETFECQIAPLHVHRKALQVHIARPRQLHSVIGPKSPIWEKHQEDVLERGLVHLGAFAVDKARVRSPNPV